MPKKRVTWNDLILRNAEKAANEALSLLEELELIESDASDLFKAGKEKILSYQSDIRNITHSYQKSLNTEKHQATLPSVHTLVEAPRKLSRIVEVISIWCAQRQQCSLSSQKSFAQLLSKRFLERLNLDIKPRTIFGAKFGVINLGTEIIIEIPYVYSRWYSKWLTIAHEVGHIYRGDHLEFAKKFDIRSLFEILTKGLPKDWSNDLEIGIPLFNWVTNWSDELIADFVAVATGGPGYIISLIIDYFFPSIESTTSTHPPTDFRIACLIEAGEQFGQDVSSFKDFRTSDSAILAKLDPAQRKFVNKEMIPDFVRWLIQQPNLSALRFEWNEFWNTKDSLSKGQKIKVPLEVEFGALVLLEEEEDTTILFEKLKSRVIQSET